MVGTAILCALAILVAGAVAAQDVSVEHSDVIFMGPKDGEIYDAYGATMVSWGSRAWQDTDGARKHFIDRVDVAHERGMRYCAGLAFRTAFAQMIDFDEGFEDSICKTLDGERILVPWLWDHEHNGHPAYWFCSNAPGYREFLRYQTRMATITDIEGLHIDDYAGTAGTEWRGGCFCEHCMAAFREYVRENVAAERLEECGVTSPEGFDYGEFLRGQGITTDDYRRKVGSTLPLGPEYLTFQYRAAAEWVAEIRAYAEELVGHPLLLSVNSSASNPKSLVISSTLSYFCGEVHHEAEERAVPKAPIFTFKLGDALDRPQVCTASGQDWAYVMEHNLPGLVRTWVAQAYAYGHQLMAPHRQWAYTQEKGTHWYESTPEDYADLYRFVRANAELFDGYEAAAQVGLVYSNAAFRRNATEARDACATLARANIPFRLLIAGDDWLEPRLSSEELDSLRAVVVTEPLELDDVQQAALDEAGERVVRWPDMEGLLALVPRQIELRGAENITVIARVVPGDAEAPFVCHLLNRNYDGETDSVERQTDFRLSIARSIFGGAEIAQATLLAPGREPTALALTRTESGVDVTVPSLGLWGIVRLGRAP